MAPGRAQVRAAVLPSGGDDGRRGARHTGTAPSTRGGDSRLPRSVAVDSPAMENTPSRRYPVKVTLPRSVAFSLFVAALAAAETPPPTPVHPVTETLHGVAITDPYRWLEDQNSPETRAWLNAQIDYTQSFLSQIGRASCR